MNGDIAVVGAGVSGLTCAAVLAERGYTPHVFAARDAETCTSGAAAAIWYPYEAVPIELAVAWGMISYGRLLDLSADTGSTGVSLVDFRFFSRNENLLPPSWATAISCRVLGRSEVLPTFTSGFAMRVPLMDAPVYLEYLRGRIRSAGGEITYGVKFARLEDVPENYEMVLNCTGYGSRDLLSDTELKPHRGQIAIVEPLKAPGLAFAFVSEDAPLTYVIPRSQDCVLGGWNDVSESEVVDRAITTTIVAECSRVLRPLLAAPPILKDERVGLRPYRSSGVRVATELLSDGRRVIHDYGHGGAGFSLSWGCAHKAAELVEAYVKTRPSKRWG